MKQIITTFIVLIFLGMSVLYFSLFEGESQDVLEYSTVRGPSGEEQVSVFEQLDYPIFREPKKLYTNENKIEINLINVGLEEDGMLEAPEDWGVGGWYEYSSKPGEPGNVIINAHFDDNFGRPAAFYELKNIQLNDKVNLVDDLGREQTYIVNEIFYVDIHDPERLQIFDQDDQKFELTLITCSGVWLPGHGYNKRLVVKAELQD